MTEDCRKLIDSLTKEEIQKYAEKVMFQNAFSAILFGGNPSRRDIDAITRNLISAGMPQEFLTTPADVISASIQLKNKFCESSR